MNDNTRAIEVAEMMMNDGFLFYPFIETAEELAEFFGYDIDFMLLVFEEFLAIA